MYLVWDNFGHWVEEPATDKDLANSVIIWLKVLECIIFNLNVFKTAVYIVMKSKKLNSEHVKNICDLTLSNKIVSLDCWLFPTSSSLFLTEIWPLSKSKAGSKRWKRLLNLNQMVLLSHQRSPRIFWQTVVSTIADLKVRKL